MTIYADSSFITSIYIQDAHAAEISRRMRLAPAIWVTPLNRSELAHAISQNVFWGKLTDGEARRARDEFLDDCINGIWIPINVPETIWDASVRLAERFGAGLGVRTLDSLHVVCALELRAERFWTFDERQARLAEAVGLNTSS